MADWAGEFGNFADACLKFQEVRFASYLVMFVELAVELVLSFLQRLINERKASGDTDDDINPAVP